MTPSGVKPYMFLDQNPANYVVEVGKKGAYFTRHLPTGRVAANVMPGGNMLIGANLAVGLVNIGIGAYNAYQIHKVAGKIEENHQIVVSHLSSIEQTLQIQQRSLEVLAFHQWQLAEQMQILRQEMQTGFSQVIKTIEDTHIKQKRAAFSERVFILDRTYRRFIDLVLAGSQVAAEQEARQVINNSLSLEVWLNVELKQIDPGQAERLPLRVAEAFSIRTKADAYAVMGEAYNNIAKKELDEFSTAIQEEVYNLCNDQTLYYIGVEVPEVIAQYVYLYRGIDRGKQLLVQPSTDILIQPEDLEWDDHLSSVRAILKDKSEQPNSSSLSTTIPLKTIADLDWYIRFTGQNKESFDISTLFKNNPNGINSRNFLSLLGIEKTIDFNDTDLEYVRKIYPKELEEKFSDSIQSSIGLEKIQIKIPSEEEIKLSEENHRIYYSPFRTSIHDQFVIISRKYPSEEIERLLSENTRITHLYCYDSLYDNDFWIMVGAPSLASIPQMVIHDSLWLSEDITKKLKEKFKVTNLNHSEKTYDWLFILTDQGDQYQSSVLPQKYSFQELDNMLQKNVNNREIFEHIAIDSRLVDLWIHDKNHKFVVTTTKNIDIEKQFIVKGYCFPLFIDDIISSGFFVTSIDIGYDNGNNTNIYYLHSKFSSKETPKQLFIKRHKFPISDIQEGWENGYNITHIVRRKGTDWLVIMSDHNYPFNC